MFCSFFKKGGSDSYRLFFSQIKQKRSAVGKRSKKGVSWKFTLDLTHPVEDGILDSANFVSLLSTLFLMMLGTDLRVDSVVLHTAHQVSGLGSPSLAPN